jgi:CDP-glucose 4,6-dehydratase
VQWIVEHMVKAWGGSASWQLDSSVQPHEANYLKLDISKAKHKLAWQPQWSLAESLQKIMDWHKAYLAKQDMHGVSINQIKEFMEGLKPCKQ